MGEPLLPVMSVRYKAAKCPLRKADDGTNRSSRDARLERCRHANPMFYPMDQSVAMKSAD